ncbi:GNAT family N-acetyltransferase [Cellulosimicrobium cellulans]|uniref:GNAT family N-acetyltransferase n=1 Tax=Cellulosimicrobium cellulans TaxID=1710 RepID=UPI0024053486|nr:GNAT family N-acetyltransferase [Cellulosimicrobium cellulans]MDF9877535.1 hypothetical protein [Cellulosimicrobium cellulans]
MVWTHEVLAVATAGEPELRAWSDLGERAADPNPYFEPTVLVPAARHLDRRGALQLLVVADGDGWRAALPFEPAERRRALRGRTSTGGSLLGFVSPYGNPLVHDEDTARGVEQLVQALLARHQELGGLVDLVHVDGASRTGRALLGALDGLGVPHRTWDQFSRGALETPDGRPVDALAALSRSRRRSLQRSRRALERELGDGLRTVWATDADAVERFLALQAAGWKGTPARGGQALLLHRSTAAWFRALAEGAGDQLRVLEVWCGADLLYSGTALVRGSRSFLLLDAFDERWARASVGSWGQVLMASELSAQGFSVDSCTDPRDYPVNTSLYPHRRELRSMTCAVGSRAERLLFGGLDRALTARRAVIERARRLTSRAAAALHAVLLPVLSEVPCVVVVV